MTQHRSSSVSRSSRRIPINASFLQACSKVMRQHLLSLVLRPSVQRQHHSSLDLWSSSLFKYHHHESAAIKHSSQTSVQRQHRSSLALWLSGIYPVFIIPIIQKLWASTITAFSSGEHPKLCIGLNLWRGHWDCLCLRLVSDILYRGWSCRPDSHTGHNGTDLTDCSHACSVYVSWWILKY